MVIEAERVLTQLSATRDVNAPALAAAWPDFCRRAIHAITAATGARDPRWYAVDLLVVEAARPVRAALRRRGQRAAVAPDPVLERAGILLGAAGDILASAPRDSVADPMLTDVNIRAAQGRVAALLAAGAHTAVRALASHVGDGMLSRESARQLAGAIEQWGREARDTIRSTTPAARDLQGLAADLARLATHSRAIVRAAVGEKLIDDGQGQCIDKALAESAAGWLEIAERWTGFHTVQPPTPSKIAVSHALGQALIAVTRDGREWADPAVLATRVDLAVALAAMRRAMDVARDVVERQSGLPERLAASGQLFAPATMLAPSVEQLHARLRPGLTPAAVGDATDLVGSVSRQPGPASVAARLLDATACAKPPSLSEHTSAARSSGLAFV